MDMQLVIKLTSGDGTGVPVGIVESPPMLYTNFKELFPSIQFSDKATPSETEPYWYGVYEQSEPPTNLNWDETYDFHGLTKNSDGIWRDTYVVRPCTEEEKMVRIEKQSRIILAHRLRALKLSDFVLLDDAPLSIKADIDKWLEYRQKLRDITKADGFPWMGTDPMTIEIATAPNGKTALEIATEIYPVRR